VHDIIEFLLISPLCLQLGTEVETVSTKPLSAQDCRRSFFMLVNSKPLCREEGVFSEFPFKNR